MNKLIIPISLINITLFLFLFLPAPIHAAGNLTVQFGIPPSSPLFVVTNLLPGDEAEKQIIVTNTGPVSHLIAIKAVRTGPVDNDPPLLEEVLQVTIDDGAGDLYGGSHPGGSQTVQSWFADSQLANGVPLSIVGAGGSTTYRIKVKFPWEAGDHFQGKSVIFNLQIGLITSNNLVINEVYYQVDGDHGLDSPLDRGIVSVNGNQVTVIISDTGAGSTNIATVNIKQVCKIIQQNHGVVINNLNLNQNTGNNQAGNNTGPVSIITGGILNFLNIFNFGNINIGSCGQMLGQNDEWIEIYNPTTQDISLKNWRLLDNSGQETVIHPNKKVSAGGFALLSKAASTWRFWNEPSSAKKIELGRQIGNGLDNEGDHLFLKNPSGQVVDFVSWGDDIAIWDPTVPLVAEGASIERLAPGVDTDQPEDWKERDPPTPGEE